MVRHLASTVSSCTPHGRCEDGVGTRIVSSDISSNVTSWACSVFQKLMELTSFVNKSSEVLGCIGKEFAPCSVNLNTVCPEFGCREVATSDGVVNNVLHERSELFSCDVVDSC